MKSGQKSNVATLPGATNKGSGPQIPEKPEGVQVRETPLQPPKKLLKTQRAIWDEYIEPAWWLEDADAMLAYALCVDFAKFLKDPDSLTSAQRSEMRRTMGELHLTVSERARLGVAVKKKPAGEGEKKAPGDYYA